MAICFLSKSSTDLPREAIERLASNGFSRPSVKYIDDKKGPPGGIILDPCMSPTSIYSVSVRIMHVIFEDRYVVTCTRN